MRGTGQERDTSVTGALQGPDRGMAEAWHKSGWIIAEHQMGLIWHDRSIAGHDRIVTGARQEYDGV